MCFLEIPLVPILVLTERKFYMYKHYFVCPFSALLQEIMKNSTTHSTEAEKIKLLFAPWA